MAEQERKIARQESRKIARKKTKLQAESVAKLDVTDVSGMAEELGRGAGADHAQKTILEALSRNNEIMDEAASSRRFAGVLNTIAQRDAENVKILSRKAVKDAQKTSGDDSYTFNNADFMKHLKRKYADSGTIQWRKLNEKAMRFCKFVPSIAFMAHAFAMDPPPKRARNAQRQQRARIVETAPEDGRKLNDDKSSTKRHLQLLAVVKKWKLGEKMPLAKLVTDPSSENGFCETIENVFAAAFLIDSGDLVCSLDGEDVIMVERGDPSTATAAATQAEQKDAGRKIESIDTKKWRDAIQRYNITKAYFTFRRDQ